VYIFDCSEQVRHSCLLEKKERKISFSPQGAQLLAEPLTMWQLLILVALVSCAAGTMWWLQKTQKEAERQRRRR